jgi:hypothetical protein
MRSGTSQLGRVRRCGPHVTCHIPMCGFCTSPTSTPSARRTSPPDGRTPPAEVSSTSLYLGPDHAMDARPDTVAADSRSRSPCLPQDLPDRPGGRSRTVREGADLVHPLWFGLGGFFARLSVASGHSSDVQGACRRRGRGKRFSPGFRGGAGSISAEWWGKKACRADTKKEPPAIRGSSIIPSELPRIPAVPRRKPAAVEITRAVPVRPDRAVGTAGVSAAVIPASVRARVVAVPVTVAGAERGREVL